MEHHRKTTNIYSLSSAETQKEILFNTEEALRREQQMLKLARWKKNAFLLKPIPIPLRALATWK